MDTSEYSNAAELAKRNRARMKGLPFGVRKAMADSGKEVLTIARTQSSGPFRTKFLQTQARRRGAGLYSMRNPAPPTNPNIINRQKGDFWAGWRVGLFIEADIYQVRLVNISRHAKFFREENPAKRKLMIPRPIITYIQLAERRAFTARLQKAGLKIMKGD